MLDHCIIVGPVLIKIICAYCSFINDINIYTTQLALTSKYLVITH